MDTITLHYGTPRGLSLNLLHRYETLGNPVGEGDTIEDFFWADTPGTRSFVVPAESATNGFGFFRTEAVYDPPSSVLTPQSVSPHIDSPREPGTWVVLLRTPDEWLPSQPAELEAALVDEYDNILEIDGHLELALVGIDDQPVAFTYLIEPTILPVTEGVAQGAISIRTDASLADVSLLATFIEKDTAPRPALQARGGTKKPTAKASRFVPDPDLTLWRHPLGDAGAGASVISTFGQYPVLNYSKDRPEAAKNFGKGIRFGEVAQLQVRAAKKARENTIRPSASGAGSTVTLVHGHNLATSYSGLRLAAGLKEGQVVETDRLLGTIAFPNGFEFRLLRTFSGPSTGCPVNPLRTELDGHALAFLPPIVPVATDPKSLREVKGEPKANLRLTLVGALSLDNPLPPGEIVVTPEQSNVPISLDLINAEETDLDDYKARPTAGVGELRYSTLSGTDLKKASTWFQFRFGWDTSPYEAQPIGPRRLTISFEDAAGIGQVTTELKLGPELVVPESVMPETDFFGISVDYTLHAVASSPGLPPIEHGEYQLSAKLGKETKGWQLLDLKPDNPRRIQASVTTLNQSSNQTLELRRFPDTATIGELHLRLQSLNFPGLAVERVVTLVNAKAGIASVHALDVLDEAWVKQVNHFPPWTPKADASAKGGTALEAIATPNSGLLQLVGILIEGPGTLTFRTKSAGSSRGRLNVHYDSSSGPAIAIDGGFSDWAAWELPIGPGIRTVRWSVWNTDTKEPWVVTLDDLRMEPLTQ
jgi:hypothetical protein